MKVAAQTVHAKLARLSKTKEYVDRSIVLGLVQPRRDDGKVGYEFCVQSLLIQFLSVYYIRVGRSQSECLTGIIMSLHAYILST